MCAEGGWGVFGDHHITSPHPHLIGLCLFHDLERWWNVQTPLWVSENFLLVQVAPPPNSPLWLDFDISGPDIFKKNQNREVQHVPIKFIKHDANWSSNVTSQEMILIIWLYNHHWEIDELGNSTIFQYFGGAVVAAVIPPVMIFRIPKNSLMPIPRQQMTQRAPANQSINH